MAAVRDEAERLVREALERKTVAVKQGNTRIEAICGIARAHRVTAARARPASPTLARNAAISRRRCSARKSPAPAQSCRE